MIVLLGYMGSGKSTVLNFLRNKTNLKCCDLDDYIEQKEKSSIIDIFKTKGEIYFRKIEHQYLKQILTENSIDILSLGGGTPCYAGNINLINEHTTDSFYLKVDLEELTERLFKEKLNRPLIKDIKDKTQLKDFIRKHLFEREFYYRQAKHVLNVTNLNTEQIVEKVLRL